VKTKLNGVFARAQGPVARAVTRQRRGGRARARVGRLVRAARLPAAQRARARRPRARAPGAVRTPHHVVMDLVLNIDYNDTRFCCKLTHGELKRGKAR
jgi:hypothetical protein